jgi:hypothetical protein
VARALVVTARRAELLGEEAEELKQRLENKGRRSDAAVSRIFVGSFDADRVELRPGDAEVLLEVVGEWLEDPTISDETRARLEQVARAASLDGAPILKPDTAPEAASDGAPPGTGSTSAAA